MVYNLRQHGRPGVKSATGFTLVEVLVSTAITTLLVIILAQTLGSVSRLWTQSTGRSGVYASARAAFEAVARNLSQATLNTYISYADRDGMPVPLINPSFKPASGTVDRSSVPVRNVRMSELHFLTGPAEEIFATANLNVNTTGHAVFFQAPTGHVNKPENRPKATLLNVLGYYVEFGSDEMFRPGVVENETVPRYRYRLMEVIQAAEENPIYASTVELDANNLAVFNYDLKWIESLKLHTTEAPKQPLADNIVLMVLLPKLSRIDSADKTDLVGDKYVYDSRLWEKDPTAEPRFRNQLPPIIELIMLAIDEPAAQLLEARYGGADGSTPPFDQLTEYVDIKSLFKEPAKLDDDLKTLEDGLAEARISYRIFRTDVTLPGAKWSNE